jgi:hypothetical protein
MEILLIVIICFILLIAIYLYYENSTLKITKHVIKSGKIDNRFNDYKIAHISDFHNVSIKRLHNKIVNTLKIEKPDIIVITGDIVDDQPKKHTLSFVSRIKNISDIYYVSGNHEKKMGLYNELKEDLINENISVLENQIIDINKNGASIYLLGIIDPSFASKAKDSNKIINDLINRINYDKSKYNILLSHRPEAFDIYCDNKIDLVFTGHAHGGQVRVFGHGLFAPNQGILPKYTSGVIRNENTNMVVSRGIGNSKFPFRINNRPELVIVTLEGDKNE